MSSFSPWGCHRTSLLSWSPSLLASPFFSSHYSFRNPFLTFLGGSFVGLVWITHFCRCRWSCRSWQWIHFTWLSAQFQPTMHEDVVFLLPLLREDAGRRWMAYGAKKKTNMHFQMGLFFSVIEPKFVILYSLEVTFLFKIKFHGFILNKYKFP